MQNFETMRLQGTPLLMFDCSFEIYHISDMRLHRTLKLVVFTLILCGKSTKPSHTQKSGVSGNTGTLVATKADTHNHRSFSGEKKRNGLLYTPFKTII